MMKNFSENTDPKPGRGNLPTRCLNLPRVICWGLVIFTFLGCLFGFRPARADEPTEALSASERFRPGQMFFSVKSSWPTSPSWILFGHASEPGLHFINSSGEDSDVDATIGKLGIDFGLFFAPQVQMDINFQFETLDVEDDSMSIFEIGGGFSRVLPIGKRLFLDLGAGAGVIIASFNSHDTNVEKLGVHSILGYFLTRNLSVGCGFAYEHWFEEHASDDILFFRSRLSYFFGLGKNNGLSNRQAESASEK